MGTSLVRRGRQPSVLWIGVGWFCGVWRDFGLILVRRGVAFFALSQCGPVLIGAEPFGTGVLQSGMLTILNHICSDAPGGVTVLAPGW